MPSKFRAGKRPQENCKALASAKFGTFKLLPRHAVWATTVLLTGPLGCIQRAVSYKTQAPNPGIRHGPFEMVLPVVPFLALHNLQHPLRLSLQLACCALLRRQKS